MNLDVLKQQIKKSKEKSGGSGSSDKLKSMRETWTVPKLKADGESVTFSIVENHKHEVEDDFPFVSVPMYSMFDKDSSMLVDKELQAGRNMVVPNSSFDPMEVDPIKAYLDMARKKDIENGGNGMIDKNLYKSLNPIVYTYVPVVVKNQENQGVKWLRLSPSVYKTLTEDILMDCVDENGKINSDFKLKRQSSTSYAIIPVGGNRAIDQIDSGILESTKEDLPALKEIHYVHNQDQIKKALRDNAEAIFGSDDDGDNGQDYTPGNTDDDPDMADLKKKTDDKLANLFGNK